MNYLDICKRTARESGTLDAATLTTVLNTSKRAGRIIGWVDDAYHQIQQIQPRGWPWQISRFTGKLTIADQADYTGAALLGEARFRRFITDAERKDAEYRPFSCYLQTDGVAQEYHLTEIPWGRFIERYLRGTQTPGKPREYAIDPQTGKLFLGPTPDDVYVLGGEWVKTNQILAVNGDIPEMPGHDVNSTDRHGDGHMIIVWGALIRLSEFDEGTFSLATVSASYRRALESLTGSEAMPMIEVEGCPVDGY